MKEEIVKKYLPMTEATYYILLCMVKPIHGYKLMQDVEALTNGTVTLGPGTLYGATSKLVKDGLIKQVESKEERRKSYQLTEIGNEILLLEYNRLNLSVENGKKILEGLEV